MDSHRGRRLAQPSWQNTNPDLCAVGATNRRHFAGRDLSAPAVLLGAASGTRICTGWRLVTRMVTLWSRLQPILRLSPAKHSGDREGAELRRAL